MADRGDNGGEDRAIDAPAEELESPAPPTEPTTGPTFGPPTEPTTGPTFGPPTEPTTGPAIGPRQRASTVKLDDGVVPAPDEEPGTQPRRRGWTTVVMSPEDGEEPDEPEEPSSEDDPAPVAVRPIGRLASDGWGLALDYAPATGIEEERLEDWLVDAIPSVEPMAATEAQPALDPPSDAMAPTVGIAELERLAAVDEGGAGEESARLEAWLGQRAGDDEPAPSTVPPITQPPRTAAASEVPFALAGASATQALEAWIDAWLQAEPPPPPSTVDPGSDAREITEELPVAAPILPVIPTVVEVVTASDDEPETPDPTPESEAPPLVSVAVYAAIKVRLWDDGASLTTALEEAGIEETTWREHELRQAKALATELRRGEATLATELRSAIAAARRAREDAAWEGLLPLSVYAAITVELESLGEELERREALLRHELSIEAWDEQRAEWARRARLERGMGRKVRRAVAEARRRRASSAAP